MNSKSNRSRILTKNISETSSKTADRQEDSLSLYKKIEEIINIGKKDTGRLSHILNTLKQDKILYKSDRQYLDDCLLDFVNNKGKKISSISTFNFAPEKLYLI